MKKLLFFLLLAATIGCKTKTNNQTSELKDTMVCAAALEVPDSISAMRPMRKLTGAVPAVIKPVGVFYEMDYSVYQHFGNSTANCMVYFNDLFTQVKKIYAFDSVTIFVAGVKIDTIEDGLAGNLFNFGNSMAVLKPHADFAQLLTFRYSGGISYLTSFCLGWQFQVSVVGIQGVVRQYPAYFWDGECSAHELGHSLGLYHSFSCKFNGNNTPIDSTNTCWGLKTEGGCPNGQITDVNQILCIMSYGHGCPSQGGILFTKGFGIQQRIIMRGNIYQFGYCLIGDTTTHPPCDVPLKPSAITGNLSVNQGSNNTYSIPAVATATSYTWSIPASWSGSSTTNSINTVAGLTGTVAVTANNTCGASLAQTAMISVVPTPPPSCATPSGLIALLPTSSSIRLTWGAASGATSYVVWYRLIGSTTWISKNVSALFLNITGLQSGKTYEWRVGSICTNVYSVFSNIQQFTTTGAPPVDTCANFSLNIAMGIQTSFTPVVTSVSTPLGNLTFQWSLNGVQQVTTATYTGSFKTGDVVVFTVKSDRCPNKVFTFTKTF